MLSFAEELFLLALDDQQGVIKPLTVSVLDYAMAGALLMDLALQNRIDTDLSVLQVTDTTPTGDPLLDEALRELAQQPAGQPTAFWLRHFADQSQRIQAETLARLIDKGILKQQNRRILWVFETRRYPLIDNREIKEVKSRLRDLILSDDIPDAREVVLVNLGNTCGLLEELFTPAEYERVRPRIALLAHLDLIGQEMVSSIREIERTMAVAMSVTLIT